jgi:hypothetical protein
MSPAISASPRTNSSPEPSRNYTETMSEQRKLSDHIRKDNASQVHPDHAGLVDKVTDWSDGRRRASSVR